MICSVKIPLTYITWEKMYVEWVGQMCDLIIQYFNATSFGIIYKFH